MNYTPSPQQAYLDIVSLRTNVWFGDLLRNLHHWSANLLVVAAASAPAACLLHRRDTARRARCNWIVGVVLLLLVLAANFTGYLLPWDQLAYWAITVGTSILAYMPLVGAGVEPSAAGRAGGRRRHPAQLLFAAHQPHPAVHRDADVATFLARAQGWRADHAQRARRNRDAAY